MENTKKKTIEQSRAVKAQSSPMDGVEVYGGKDLCGKSRFWVSSNIKEY